ncbi:MAG: hypothetical protein J6M53_05385 [Bacteroidaceae bacterium]|nr:hypothetical protein [Bacteroidaceae bacterium]
MAKELSTIITNAAEVRDASETAENTAARVGGVLCDLLEHFVQVVTAGNIALKADSSGTGFTVSYYNAAGQNTTQTLLLPEVSNTLKGLLTPAMLSKLNTAYSQSATNKTDIATRKAEIQELEKRLKGTSDNSNAFSDPFLFLGDKDGIDEVNETLDAIVAEAADPETKFTGHCVVGLKGTRFNVHTYALHFATGDFVQCIEGPVKTDNTGQPLRLATKYGVYYRRISNFYPSAWSPYYDQVPEATEEHSGLLMDTEKWFLNCFRNYGEVSSSAVAENAAKSSTYFEANRPLIMFYYDKAKKQCGLLISLPAGENIHGQTLLLGANIYRRTVTVSGTTSTATAWTAV